MNHAHDPSLPEPPSHALRVPDTRTELLPRGYPSASDDLPRDDDIIDLREYWHTLLRRKWTVALAVIVAAAIAIVATFNATPIYKATTLIQIDRSSTQVVEYGQVQAEETGFYRDTDFYQTQFELLRSRALARRVIDEVGLRAMEDAENEGPSLLSTVKTTVKTFLSSLAGQTEEHTELAAIDPDLVRRNEEEELFLESLEIAPVRDSRLVKISFDSAYPQEAATIANSMAEAYLNFNLERRFDASAYAKEFLEEQLEEARATLERSERRFADYAREREIVNIDDRLEIMLNKLREMNAKLVETEAERFEAESEYQEFREASAGGAPDVLASEVIQSLKQRRGDLQADYQQNLEVYKPGYPKMQKLKRQIDELSQEIARETAAISDGVKAEYEAKLREEAKLRQRIDEVKQEALSLQDRSTDYETLRREVETNRELYNGLLQRMKEVGVAAGVGDNNVSIVDAAQIPLEPYKPSLPKNLAIAIALGLFAGVGLAFLLEALDDTIKVAEEVEKRVGAPVLSLLPYSPVREHSLKAEQVPLLAARDPKSAVAEAVRSLRTSLLFSTEEGAPRIMHFTSSSPNEGKTTTAISTAIAFAQAGGKVLLIDADLRNPSLHRVFTLPNSTGLTNYLAADADPAEIAQSTEVERLFTVTSGPLPPNPVELLSTAKMVDLLTLASEKFDYVVIDGPPVIGLADALVLANLARATLFVVEAGSTRRQQVEGAIRRLRQAHARVLGAVLTKVGRSGTATGYGYGYGYGYDYLYSYGGKQGKKKLLGKKTA